MEMILKAILGLLAALFGAADTTPMNDFERERKNAWYEDFKKSQGK